MNALGIDINLLDSISLHSYVTVPMLCIAGLRTDDSTHKMFFRTSSYDCYNHLSNPKSNLSLIQGPPGTGKSLVTWTWALNQMKKKNPLDQKKKILWIHVNEFKNICLELANNTITPFSFDNGSPQFNDLIKMIESQKNNKEYNIYILDGILKNDLKHRHLVNCLFDIRSSNTSKNSPDPHIVVVVSLAYYINPEDESSLGIDIFLMKPWTFDEYINACKNDELWNSVKKFVEVEAPTLKTNILQTNKTIQTRRSNSRSTINQEDKPKPEDRTKHIASKFYYAGSSARWMFAHSQNEVKNFILKYFRKVNIYTFSGSVRYGH